MTNFLRIAAAAAALTLSATPALASTQPDKQASATARVVKPLTLAWVQDLDLGSITLVGSGSTTVGISRLGVFSCPAGNVTCSGTPQVAKYKITGVNNTNVTVNTTNVTLTNQADATKTLTMTVDSPGTVNLGNSGTSGTEFPLGGAITVSGATAEGTYSGTFAVTVNY
jgi:hypothetical protein